MDYTNKPSENMTPGPENFLFLEEMYGTVNNGRRSWLRRLMGTQSAVLPAQIHDEMVRAVQQMEQRSDGQEHLDGWLEEHRNEHGSVHSREFGGGYTVKVAKLLVRPEE